MDNKIMRLPEVCEAVGLSETTIWRLEREGLFPARRKLSAGTVGWLKEEIDGWIESRIKLGDQS